MINWNALSSVDGIDVHGVATLTDLRYSLQHT